MAKTILTAVVIVSMNILVGCHGVDSGDSQILPPLMKTAPPAASPVDVSEASEVDIIEQMAINRQAYRQYLGALIAYYNKVGNSMKLAWAENELKMLDGIPQYNYIVDAALPGPDLKASFSIPLADYLYQEAVRLENKAGQLLIIKNEDELRLALEKYNQLIRKHPTSDKIDDAAFRAGKICEYFKDYTIALLYYQRTYQWDPMTPHPAEFKAAYILDNVMSRRDEALELYQKALEKGGLRPNSKEFVEMRIKSLSKAEESLGKK